MNPVVDNLLRSSETRLALLAVLFGVGFALEWAAPIRVVRFRDRALNIACGFFFHAADLLSGLCMSSLLLIFSPRPLLPFAVDDGHRVVFGIAIAFVWLAVRDFFYYWFHRLQHYSKWMWAEHALHHSDEQMNVTTAVRHHWLEMPLNTIFIALPVTLLFQTPNITIPVAYVLTYAIGYMIHLNLRITSGKLAWILASPQNHRIHHSKSAEHLDKNFAQALPLWDVIFGTYYKPAPDEYPETGLCSGEQVTTLRKALTMPFHSWAQMLESVGPRPIKQAETIAEK
jgi:sterol desaturase/sphingolipid hydroxylase (fatty acid hydroxylase superfamily)